MLHPQRPPLSPPLPAPEELSRLLMEGIEGPPLPEPEDWHHIDEAVASLLPLSEPTPHPFFMPHHAPEMPLAPQPAPPSKGAGWEDGSDARQQAIPRDCSG
ncbi:hypothetical protein CSUI_009698, partial [Cystoisospora suis]